MNILWFSLFVIFLIVEIVTVGLVSIWFSFGSLFALLTTCFTDNIYIQASGYMLWPDNYKEVRENLNELFMKIYNEK